MLEGHAQDAHARLAPIPEPREYPQAVRDLALDAWKRSHVHRQGARNVVPLSPREALQFLRWKYRRRFSALGGATPTLRASFSAYAILRSLLYKPLRDLARRLRDWNKTETDLYNEEMRESEKLNEFFGEGDGRV